MKFDLGRDLFEACLAGDLCRVEEVLGATSLSAVEWRNSGTGWTPLHAAVDAKNFEIIRRLIRAGAPIDARDSVGDTPLHLALHKELEESPLENGERKASLELTRILLDAGANPKTRGGDTDSVGLARLYRAKEAERLLAKYVR